MLHIGHLAKKYILMLAAYIRHTHHMRHAALRVPYKCTDRLLSATVCKAALQCHEMMRHEPSAVMAACPECHTILVCFSTSVLFRACRACTCTETQKGFCMPGYGLLVMEPSVAVTVS